MRDQTLAENLHRMPAGIQGAVFRRSLALQASWNPQRMQNLGLLVTLVPWLRWRRPGLQESRRICRRHYEFFNTNPYLANFIIGGLIRLETDRLDSQSVSEELIRTFRNSLAQSFASLGDQLFWLGLQPALLLLACLLGLWFWPWLPLGLLILFAIGQFLLRHRALIVGFRLGLQIVDLISHPGWHGIIAVAKKTGMVLAGFLGGFYLARFGGGPDGFGWLPVLALAAFGAGAPLVCRQRLPAEAVFLSAVPLALILTYL